MCVGGWGGGGEWGAGEGGERGSREKNWFLCFQRQPFRFLFYFTAAGVSAVWRP